mgnify:CR=1 FL=1
MIHCAKCGKAADKILFTIYNEPRCEHCYDDYLMTDRGKVEYMLNLVNGEIPMEEFDADFLGHVAVCWNKYRDELPISNKNIAEIEIQAAYMGLL